ncbi:rho GTPase-activating protein 27-like isoform X1 [Solea senegalensis]|uniref:Rho GTPase-activating protein 27-like isoform X1 n=1 Tax=Solea senegalensis TaxID=28829 RepID=A0AAV6RHE4_SOLSE|nr:rho GTPase-activating protein 27-like isoform X1 [Solea senegalensis]
MATASPLLNSGLGLVLVEFQYEYQGRDGVLVSIKPNERYVLLAKTNDHWWQVRRDCSSKPFYIPAKYVKELPSDFPSPLDFADPPSPEPVLVPVAAPVPVPVPIPVPKTLEEPSGNRTKPGDEVTIRLRPDVSTGYRKTENRMSTFGVPLDLNDLPVTTSPPAPPVETGTLTETDSSMSKKQPPLLGCLEEHGDSGKSRLPNFSPAEPTSVPRAQTQPIPVETPVVPVNALVSPSNDTHSTTAGTHVKQESPIQQEEEQEEEQDEEEQQESSEEEEEEQDSLKDSNHIYESIQDLNLDLESLVRGRENSGGPPDTAPAPPPSQDDGSLGPNLAIYANITLKKSSLPLISDHAPIPPPPMVPAPSTPGCTPSSTVSSPGMISPTSLLSPKDEWQDSCVWEQLMDDVSGRFYYFNPTTGATSWTAPEPLSPSSTGSPTSRRQHFHSPPPLPEEDYPVTDYPKDDDAVFTSNPQQPVALIPRAQLDLKDGNSSHWRLPEIPHVPQRRMGNGVSEDSMSLQVRNWRHSVAEDTFGPTHRRNVSDITDVSNRRLSPDSPQGHLLEKAGIINKTKVADNGKKIRKNWSQSWTVLHGGILTFHKDPKSAPTGTAGKASQIVPEFTVDLRGSSICWASRDKSSKKNVLEMKTRHGCEFLMQYDTESIISDWFKVIQDAIKQLEQDHLTEDEDETASDREDKDQRRTPADSEQRRVRTKLRRFLQRRPTLQSVKEKGYIRDNVFGCHLDTLCHRENSTVPKFVDKCVRVVERRGLDVDGIYRVSGNLAVIQKLRHKADHEDQLDLDDGQWQDIHVITGALKLFLRELPEPLFPFSCFHKFIAAIQLPDYNLRVSYMQDLVQSLPLPNHDTMELLFKHLRRVIEHKDSNRMSFQSVAIVFGPTLLRPQTESPNMTIHMVFQSQIVELILNEYHKIFSQR